MNIQTSKLRAAVPVKPAPSKFSHVVLTTTRFEEMRDFYLTVLCARPAFENDRICFMTYDEEDHRLGIVSRPDLAPVDKTHAGLEHISFTYPTLELLLAAYLHNKEQGIEPFWPIIHGPTVSIYYHDPDGNKVEFQYDVFPDQAAIAEYMATGAYEENFIGIIFDVDQMVADFEAGVSLEDLVRRPLLPEGVSPWDMIRH